ncbi:MAG: TlpA disulfide reductase family protein [Reichenbachiella sp.]|uniref:TlpA family protein disulfide reductase n=1 Tax=Reichenbachiella sp. TaxID=2184521 RepID=UPI003265DB42
MIRIIMVCCCAWLYTGISYAQSKLPAVDIERMDGKVVSATEVVNTDGPTIVSFWATWCKPCVLELNEMQDQYADWKDETQVKIVSISIDDARSSGKVNAFVSGRRWDFDVYLDKNSDLKRALNISNIPFTIVLDKNGDIISKHAGYVPGDEDIIYEEILEAASGE